MSSIMNAPLVAVLEKARVADPVLAEKIIPDRIHPSAAGGLVMAAAILKAWNAPAVVSAVEIDVSSFPSASTHQENTRITELLKNPTLSWTQEDNALPMPFDPKDDALALVLQSSNIVESLDQELLKVTGLPAPKYSVKIDGEEIGAWTREDLARGVNLAVLATPMLKQALECLRVLGADARRPYGAVAGRTGCFAGRDFAAHQRSPGSARRLGERARRTAEIRRRAESASL